MRILNTLLIILLCLSAPAIGMYDPNYPIEDNPGCMMSEQEMAEMQSSLDRNSVVLQEGKFVLDLGEGFDDPTPVAPVGGNSGTTLGQQRVNALREAVRLVEEFLPGTVPIDAGMRFFSYSSTGILASAGISTYYYGQDTEEFDKVSVLYPSALAKQLMNSPPSGSAFSVTFNATRDTLTSGKWYYGFDRSGGSDIDFITVAIHEIVHGLGSSTAFSRTTGEVGSSGRFNIYVHHLEEHSTGRLFPNMTAAERLAAGTSITDMHIRGPYTNGWAVLNSNNSGVINGHVAIYAPSQVQSGSSYVHPSNLLSPNNLMEPFYTGPTHNTSLVEAILLDAGWSEVDNVTPTTTTTTLPNPGTCDYDVDCSGAVTVSDALRTLQVATGISVSCTCD